MFNIGDEVILISRDCDYYERSGNAVESGIVDFNERYVVEEINNVPGSSGTVNRSEPIIRINANNGWWWLKASAFIKVEDSLNLPEWF